jgi:hypothetical protein
MGPAPTGAISAMLICLGRHRGINIVEIPGGCDRSGTITEESDFGAGQSS